MQITYHNVTVTQFTEQVGPSSNKNTCKLKQFMIHHCFRHQVYTLKYTKNTLSLIFIVAHPKWWAL